MADGGLVTQPLEVDDFAGGKTDNYISGRPNQFQDADNMVLRQHGNKGKLVTRPGQTIYDEDYYRIPANDRLSGLAECDGTLFQLHGRNVYHVLSGWQTVQGPTTNPALSTGSASSFFSFAVWNKHLLLTNNALPTPTKIFHDGTSWKARTLGLPAVSTAGITFTKTAGASSYNFIYAFIYSDEYTANSLTYREVGPSEIKACSLTTASAPGIGTPIAITVLPSLANAATGNYNTAGLKLEIYRTTHNGTVFYKVGEVTNGTTSFNDTVTDALLVANETLYTEGGTVDFDPAPASEFVVVNGNIAYYINGRTVRQSVPGALYAAPEDFYDETPDNTTGAGLAGTTVVVFCQNKMYRVEGVFDEFGQGGMSLRLINSTVGCVSHRSIVAARDGLYFASEKGFCFTDGFTVQVISDEFPTSYQDLMDNSTTKSRIYAGYDSTENRIWWAAQRDPDSNDNDIVFVAHLKSPETPFTTLSGADLPDNFAPSSLIYFGGEMLMGDRRGYLIRFNEDSFSDLVIDTATTPDNWEQRAIVYDYRSAAFDFGTTMVRKWTPRIVVNADNVTNLAMTIYSNADNTGIFSPLAEIKYSSNAIWGDVGATWGDPDSRWNYSAVISHWRRFPSPIRCVYRQIRLTNSHSEIDSSTLVGTASTDNGANTVTLDTVDALFAEDSVGYYISFGEDSYEREFLITAVSGNELTVTDSENALTTLTGRQWKIRGAAKNRVLSLLSYVITYSGLTMTQQSYQAEG